MKRLITGLILTPAFFWLVVYAPPLAFLGGLAAVGCFCLWEFLGIAAATHPRIPDPRRFWPAFVAGLLLLVLPSQLWMLMVVTALAVLVFFTWRGPLEAVLPMASAVVFGVIYTFGPWRAAAELRASSPWWLLFAVAVNWVGDTFAYYGGRLFGSHRMSPEISPNKTWEGAAASLASSAIVGVAFLGWQFPQVAFWQASLLAVLANLAGQVGDLAESAIKRGAGVKDSGNLLPGHGGWLDRVDSSLFSVPVVYWLLQAWGLVR